MRYVGRKTMRKLQSRANNEHFTAAPDKDSFGRAMMEKMGWAEGKGVGKNEDGMRTHIRAQKRGAPPSTPVASAAAAGEAPQSFGVGTVLY